MPKHSCDNIIKDFKNLDNQDSEALEQLELNTGISRKKLKQAQMITIDCNGSTHLVGRQSTAHLEKNLLTQSNNPNSEVSSDTASTTLTRGDLVSNLNHMARNQTVETIEQPPSSNGADPAHVENKLTDLTSFEKIQASGLTDQEINELIARPLIKPRPLEKYQFRLAANALEEAGYDVSSLRESLDLDAPPSGISLTQE